MIPSMCQLESILTGRENRSVVARVWERRYIVIYGRHQGDFNEIQLFLTVLAVFLVFVAIEIVTDVSP